MWFSMLVNKLTSLPHTWQPYVFVLEVSQCVYKCESCDLILCHTKKHWKYLGKSRFHQFIRIIQFSFVFVTWHTVSFSVTSRFHQNCGPHCHFQLCPEISQLSFIRITTLALKNCHCFRTIPWIIKFIIFIFINSDFASWHPYHHFWFQFPLWGFQ